MSPKHHEAFIIDGGISLNGTVNINGSKNAALCAIAASLLTEETIIMFLKFPMLKVLIAFYHLLVFSLLQMKALSHCKQKIFNQK